MTFNENQIRWFYLNINSLNIGHGYHSLLQLYQTIQEKGVDIVCITETNVYWERCHIYHQLKKRSTMCGPKNRISFCTSEFNIKWNSNYKPGGAVTFILNNVSSAILRKEQESSGIGRWTYLTILGKYNRRTTIFTMYRQCKKASDLLKIQQ